MRGPTFASIACRLAALRDRVNAEAGLGTFRAKLAKTLEKARTLSEEGRMSCAEGNQKKATKRIQKAAKALASYVHRLKGLSARKKLDATLREAFLAAGEVIAPDVATLRGRVSCPADAALRS